MDENVVKQKIQKAFSEPQAPEEVIQQVILRSRAIVMGNEIPEDPIYVKMMEPDLGAGPMWLSSVSNKKGNIVWIGKTCPLAHKIATVIAGLAVVVWLIAKVQPNLLPFDPTYLAVAVFTICEAVTYWKTKRVWAWVLIAGAVISIACCLLELMLKF